MGKSLLGNPPGPVLRQKHLDLTDGNYGQQLARWRFYHGNMELQSRFHQSQAAAEGGIHITNLLNSAAQVEVTIAIYHLDIFSLSASTLREKKQVK